MRSVAKNDTQVMNRGNTVSIMALTDDEYERHSQDLETKVEKFDMEVEKSSA